MKRTAAVLLASLIIVFYTMSYMRINAAGAETAAPIEENSSEITETLPPSDSGPDTTTKIVDIPKPVLTTEAVITVPETTETEPVTEETTVTVTETVPESAETTEPVTAAETTLSETERETVPPPATIEQETRAPVIVLHLSQDKVLAQVTVAINPPDTVKPVPPAVTAAQAQTTASKPEPVSIAATGETVAAAQTTSADDMIQPAAAVIASKEDATAFSPKLTVGSVAVIGAGAAAITALLYVLRFAKRP